MGAKALKSESADHGHVSVHEINGCILHNPTSPRPSPHIYRHLPLGSPGYREELWHWIQTSVSQDRQAHMYYNWRRFATFSSYRLVSKPRTASNNTTLVLGPRRSHIPAQPLDWSATPP